MKPCTAAGRHIEWTITHVMTKLRGLGLTVRNYLFLLYVYLT